MATGAFIAGCAGLELTSAEIAFFGETQPWGLILFARNVDTPDQIARSPPGSAKSSAAAMRRC
jgi:beta-N-acetylhexosaminidase